MKREAKELLERSLDSLLTSIRHFNDPMDRGRQDAVLIFLDRAFELLLKATIVHRGGAIREAGEKHTIGHDKCVRKCLSDEALRCLDGDDALTIQNINLLRGAAQHYFLTLSDQYLYLQAQAGLTLFRRIYRDVFRRDLSQIFPARALPITTSPPADFIDLIDTEFGAIAALLRRRRRRELEAKARLRPLAIVEASISGQRSQPSDKELGALVRKIRSGRGWRDLFPGVASLRLETEGAGFDISIRITKREGEPVQLVQEGTPGATVVGVRKVDATAFYSLGCKQLAENLGLNQTQTLAMVETLGVRGQDNMYREFRMGKQVHKQYSREALEFIRERMAEDGVLEQACEAYQTLLRERRRRAPVRRREREAVAPERP